MDLHVSLGECMVPGLAPTFPQTVIGGENMGGFPKIRGTSQ